MTSLLWYGALRVVALVILAFCWLLPVGVLIARYT